MATTWLERLLEPERIQIDAHALVFALALLGTLLGLGAMIQMIRRFGKPGSGLSHSEAILGFPVGILAFVLPGVALLALSVQDPSSSLLLAAVVQILVAAAAITVVAVHPWRALGEARGEWCAVRPRQLIWVPLLWLLGLPVLQLAMLASVQLHELIGAAVESQGVVDKLREAVTPGEIATWYLMAVIAAPLMEEFVFRVVLFGGTRRLLGGMAATSGWSQPIALVFSVSAFVLAHGVWGWTVGILPLTMLSVILTLLYSHTKSIWPSMLYHALHNAFVVTMQLFVLTR